MSSGLPCQDDSTGIVLVLHREGGPRSRLVTTSNDSVVPLASPRACSTRCGDCICCWRHAVQPQATRAGSETARAVPVSAGDIAMSFLGSIHDDNRKPTTRSRCPCDVWRTRRRLTAMNRLDHSSPVGLPRSPGAGCHAGRRGPGADLSCSGPCSSTWWSLFAASAAPFGGTLSRTDCAGIG